MEAIHAHLKSKNIEWRHAEYDDIWIEFKKPVYRDKKHKNGKVVKCKHGYPEREFVKWENRAGRLKNLCRSDGFRGERAVCEILVGSR